MRVRSYGGIHQSSASPHLPCNGTSPTSIWTSHRRTPGSLCPYPSDRTLPAGTVKHVGRSLGMAQPLGYPQERTRWAESSAGSRATCPCRRSWHSWTMQVTRFNPASMSSRSLDILVLPHLPNDSTKWPSTKRVQPPSWFALQSPGLARMYSKIGWGDAIMIYDAAILYEILGCFQSRGWTGWAHDINILYFWKTFHPRIRSYRWIARFREVSYSSRAGVQGGRQWVTHHMIPHTKLTSLRCCKPQL